MDRILSNGYAVDESPGKEYSLTALLPRQSMMNG